MFIRLLTGKGNPASLSPRSRRLLTLMVASVCVQSTWLRAEDSKSGPTEPVLLSIAVYRVVGDQANLDKLEEGSHAEPLQVLGKAGNFSSVGLFVGPVWLDEKAVLTRTMDVPWVRSLGDPSVPTGTRSLSMESRGLTIELLGTRAESENTSTVMLDYDLILAVAPPEDGETSAQKPSRGQRYYSISGKSRVEADKPTLVRLNRALRRNEQDSPDGTLIAAIIKLLEPSTAQKPLHRKFAPSPTTAARIETISAVVPRALFTPDVLLTMQAQGLPMRELANRLKREGRVIEQSAVEFHTDLRHRADMRFKHETPLPMAEGIWAPEETTQQHETDVELGTSEWIERTGLVTVNIPVDLKTRTNVHTPLKPDGKVLFPCPLSLRYKETARCQAGVSNYRIWSTPSLDGDTDDQTITITTLTMMPEKL